MSDGRTPGVQGLGFAISPFASAMAGSAGSSSREAGEGSGARAGARAEAAAGGESSRRLSGRRKLRVARGTSSRGEIARPSGGETLAIDLVSSGDDRSGGRAGPGQDDGGAPTGIQQGLPNTPTVRRPARVGTHGDLTPNFRSAAAMAGWDDEALLMAAIGRGTPEGPPGASCSSSCEGCALCRERKRETRTPGQAATPLSAGRRHRRVRRVNEDPLVPIPMAVFADEGYKCGEPAREAEGSRQQPSEAKEKKDTKPCVNATSMKATAEAAEGNAGKNDSLQLDKLREELTCVVCLDICFEPSTTSCGHSFCRGCLQSVYIKCGMRCPKCRQELRTSSMSDCPINTVLWNTIQLLFPRETAARLKDHKSNREKDNQTLMDSASTVEAESQLRLGLVRRRIIRPVPWRDLGIPRGGTEQSRPNVGSASESLRWRGPGNQASFRRASEVLESAQSNYPNGFLRLRGRRPTSSTWRSPEIQRQEEEDAALAARLQESFISEARQ